jgi:hypothetical protein
MPLYNFRCTNEKCQKLTKRIMSVQDYDDSSGWISCPDCAFTALREMSGATSKAMERLDNGFMARPVERLSEAQRIFAERAAEHQRQHRSTDQLD